MSGFINLSGGGGGGAASIVVDNPAPTINALSQLTLFEYVIPAGAMADGQNAVLFGMVSGTLNGAPGVGGGLYRVFFRLNDGVSPDFTFASFSGLINVDIPLPFQSAFWLVASTTLLFTPFFTLAQPNPVGTGTANPYNDIDFSLPVTFSMSVGAPTATDPTPPEITGFTGVNVQLAATYA